MNDQTIKADAGKPRLTLVPRRILTAIARVREYGCTKYKNNECWKAVELERYKDAAFRHMLAYLDNPRSVDVESGLPHLWHLACNIAFLIELEPNETYGKSNDTKICSTTVYTESQNHAREEKNKTHCTIRVMRTASGRNKALRARRTGTDTKQCCSNCGLFWCNY